MLRFGTKVHTDILDPATKSPWYDAIHYDGVGGLADVERASLTVWRFDFRVAQTAHFVSSIWRIRVAKRWYAKVA